MGFTKLESVYNACVDNPHISNKELEESLDIDSPMVRTYLSRLKKRGYIDTDIVDGSRVFEILRPFRVDTVRDNVSFKGECYREMIDVLMDDFRSCDNYKERIEVGNVIRLLLKEIY